MPVNTCSECPVSEVLRIKDAVETRVMNTLPEEIREPLQEAKRNTWLAFSGLVNYLAGEINKTTQIYPLKKISVE